MKNEEVTNSFRQARIKKFLAIVDPIIARKGSAHILDVGGTVGYWNALKPLWQDRAMRFTIVNMNIGNRDDGVYQVRDGDARAMPQFDDNSFDVVHSNSVIEHVGHWPQIRAMAQEIRRLAPAYYVQTPNLWFPIEPHFKLPFVHWLPEAARASVLRARKGRYMPADASIGHATEFVQTYNLLSRGQMHDLFPDASIEAERFMGFAKSLIAVRR